MPLPVKIASQRLIKKRTRTIPIPTLTDLQLHLQDRGKQADSVRHDAYQLSKLFGRDILIALRDENKIGMKDRAIQWGIAADKVLGGTETTGLSLHVPTQLLDKLALALRIGTDKPAQMIDKTE